MMMVKTLYDLMLLVWLSVTGNFSFDIDQFETDALEPCDENFGWTNIANGSLTEFYSSDRLCLNFCLLKTPYTFLPFFSDEEMCNNLVEQA